MSKGATPPGKGGAHILIAIAAGFGFLLWWMMAPRASSVPGPPSRPMPPQKWEWEMVKTYPHDPKAFTQGLLWHNGALYESTGLYGQSSVRKVELATGKVLEEKRLDSRYFGEGLALIGNELIQLTWQEGTAYYWNLDPLSLKRTRTYRGEGWGLATQGKELLMSDGTDVIRVMDPADFKERRRIAIRSDLGPVYRLNELEVVGGLLLANIYGSDKVAVIDLRTGFLKYEIDFSNLFPPSERTPEMDVLNGLAWRSETGTLLVTGKRWPLLFEVKVLNGLAAGQTCESAKLKQMFVYDNPDAPVKNSSRHGDWRQPRL